MQVLMAGLKISVRMLLANQAQLFILLIIFQSQLSFIVASKGDNSNEFKGCYHTCHFNKCSFGNSLYEFYNKQGIFERVFLWSCEDECKYECMWHATNIHLSRGWEVPQFYGKWPFIRIFGIQEPASVLFSLLNFVAHVINFKHFRRTVPPNAPLYSLWNLYFTICLNAWIWSMVFHSRDTPFTERLDYFSAFSMVLSSFLMLFVRIFGKRDRWKIAASVLVSCFFLYHVWYLSTRSFDYGYNMKVNVFVGVANGFGWLLWSYGRPDQRPYLYWCRLTVACAGASMALELLDFPPIFWILDAHALWHLSTAVLPFFWCRFVERDSFYMLEKASGNYKLKKSV